MIPDGFHSIGDNEIIQIGASSEGTPADAFDGIWQGHTRQAGTVGKCSVVDGCDLVAVPIDGYSLGDHHIAAIGACPVRSMSHLHGRHGIKAGGVIDAVDLIGLGHCTDI